MKIKHSAFFVIALTLIAFAAGGTRESFAGPATAPTKPLELHHAASCADSHGAFIETGSLLTPRSAHGATVLRDGRVLLAGGIAGGSAHSLRSAEIYDPASGSFRQVGNMLSPRSRPNLTTLNDGRVLVTGGWVSTLLSVSGKGTPAATRPTQGAVYTTEIFDPKTEKFKAGPVLPSGYAVNSAILLDDGKVLTLGTTNAGLTMSEIYDPATGKITKGGVQGVTRREALAAVRLTDGRVLIACGAVFTHWKSAQTYNPKTNDFTLVRNMSNPMMDCSATLLPDGKVLVVGYIYKGYEAQLYDPNSDTFRGVDLHADLADPLLAALSAGKVLVTSAPAAFPGHPQNSLLAFVYDSHSGKPTLLGELPGARFDYSSTPLPDGGALLAGGTNRPAATRGANTGPALEFPAAAIRYCP
jgi:hypothetical protein